MYVRMYITVYLVTVCRIVKDFFYISEIILKDINIISEAITSSFIFMGSIVSRIYIKIMFKIRKCYELFFS